MVPQTSYYLRDFAFKAQKMEMNQPIRSSHLVIYIYRVSIKITSSNPTTFHHVISI